MPDQKSPSSDNSLSGIVLDALQRFPLGLSEYDLIKFIQAEGHLHFKQAEQWDKLPLFRMHFILFHTLYKLRDEYWQHHDRVLEISPLKIILRPHDQDTPGEEHNLTTHDPLRDYYLDLDNYENTGEEDVNDLLTSFWVRLGANEQRHEALKVLELQDPVDADTIKKQYRRLAMKHHPDRGGDNIALQTLNSAMSVLEKCQTGVKR